jgi:hypothetical protein
MTSAYQDTPMRTTINLDKDVYEAVTTLSQSSGLSLGKVLSEVARRGLRPRPAKKKGNKGTPTFEVSPQARMIPGMLAYKIMAEEGTT